MDALYFLLMRRERLPCRSNACGSLFCFFGRCRAWGCHFVLPLLLILRRAFRARTALPRPPEVSSLFQSRKPPMKALALLPSLQPLGSFFSFLALPPPITRSCGFTVSIMPLTISSTFLRHRFLPSFSSARRPT